MRKKQKIINLYHDESIGSIKHVISIGNEEDLNQFWHYFHSEVINDYRLLYRFIGLMYRFTSKLFEKDKDLFFELIIEQTDEIFYFTVWNAIVSKYLEEKFTEYEHGFEYLIDTKRICIKLGKERLLEQGVIYNNKQKNRRREIISSVQDKVYVLQPAYDFLHDEDKEEILNLCDDMSDIIYRAKKVGFDHDVLIRLRSCLSMFSLCLMNYKQVSHISNLSLEFSVLINMHEDKFKKMLVEEFALIEGYIHNIERWINSIFVTGGAELHFMDNSLKADLDMIKMLVVPQEFTETSIDDIFDF